MVYGEDDLITLPWYNETVAAHVPGARVVAIPHAGHLLWLERPEVLSRAIEEFLAETGDASGRPRDNGDIRS